MLHCSSASTVARCKFRKPSVLHPVCSQIQSLSRFCVLSGALVIVMSITLWSLSITSACSSSEHIMHQTVHCCTTREVNRFRLERTSYHTHRRSAQSRGCSLPSPIAVRFHIILRRVKSHSMTRAYAVYRQGQARHSHGFRFVNPSILH